MFRIKLPMHTGQKRTFFTIPENDVRLGVISVGENFTGSAAATSGNADPHRFSFSKCPPELAGEIRTPDPIKNGEAFRDNLPAFLTLRSTEIGRYKGAKKMERFIIVGDR